MHLGSQHDLSTAREIYDLFRLVSYTFSLHHYYIRHFQVAEAFWVAYAKNLEKWLVAGLQVVYCPRN
jgi:hypothetical protein